jgi:hypothetical protein
VLARQRHEDVPSGLQVLGCGVLVQDLELEGKPDAQLQTEKQRGDVLGQPRMQPAEFSRVLT